ncbi:MAG TPA: NAD(P)-binding domain-containing protein, partial [Solirubrobacteraceae bacterium]|nr:NAD(P)-binding domain-containing protein [Solirubrobacteraceae bacterium]
MPPSDSSRPVAVIGASGALGFGLAVRFARAGVAVAIGSRDLDRAQETAARAQERVAAGTFEAFDNAGAARAADVVILSVPFRN